LIATNQPTPNMDKQHLLAKYGDTYVRDILGILHNYTPNDTIEEHEALHLELKKWHGYKFKDAIQYLSGVLSF